MQKTLLPVFLLFCFCVGAQAQIPEIIDMQPGQHDAGIPANSVVGAMFNDIVDSTTVTDATVLVRGQWSGAYAGEISYQPGALLAIFAPESPFNPGESITVTLTSGLQGSDGTPLSGGFSWNFTTEVNPNSKGVFFPEVNYSTGDRPYSVSSGDVDGDGDYDLITTNYDADSISVFYNNSNGIFAARADFPVGDGPWISVCVDFDGDGDLDIATTNQKGDDITVTFNNGSGMFSGVTHYPAGYQPHGLAAADFDGDGDIDLAVPNRWTNDISLYINNGNGTFAPQPNLPAGMQPISIVAADLDNDGDYDLATSNYEYGTTSILLNNGDGTFAGHFEIDTDTGSFSLIATNIDDDNDADLVVVNRNADNISVLVNDGNANFVDRIDYPVETQPYSLCSGDFNADHHLDLAVANFYGPSVTVLINNGDGTFATDAIYPVGNPPYDPVWVIATDVNGNGMLDIVTSNSYSDNISVLTNQPKVGISINPELLYACETNVTDTSYARIYLYGQLNGHDLINISSSTVMINGTLAPTHFDYPALDMFEITVSRPDLIELYGILYDTTVQPYTVSGEFHDGIEFSISGEITLIGHRSGDVNSDGNIDLLDLLYLIEHVYNEGPEPLPDIRAGDLDRNDTVNLLDILALIGDIYEKQ